MVPFFPVMGKTYYGNEGFGSDVKFLAPINFVCNLYLVFCKID